MGAFSCWAGHSKVDGVQQVLERVGPALRVDLVIQCSVIIGGTLDTHGSAPDPTDTASFLSQCAVAGGVTPTALRQALLALVVPFQMPPVTRAQAKAQAAAAAAAAALALAPAPPPAPPPAPTPSGKRRSGAQRRRAKKERIAAELANASQAGSGVQG
ncbi:hypothetical protein JCM9279_004774 [Rhodotorula babjevae]